MSLVPTTQARRRTLRLAAFGGSLIALLSSSARPAHASFHLNEIDRVMTSYNGDATVQAVELKMLASGENLVTGLSIKTYDAAGVLLATHGTFTASLPAGGALAGRKILCATSAFATKFGITPDLVITAGLPLANGQVSYESATCLGNVVAYGSVTTVKNGATTAAAIPSGLAYVLARTVDDGILASCPLAEDAAARFTIQSGSSAAPVVFANNAGTTVSVFSTLTGVGEVAAPAVWRAYPNPFRSALSIETPHGGRVAVYDVRGGLVAVLSAGGDRGEGVRRLEWDGRDARGRRAPAGVYFIGFGDGAAPSLRRVVLLR
jgi:hypothetical protein